MAKDTKKETKKNTRIAGMEGGSRIKDMSAEITTEEGVMVESTTDTKSQKLIQPTGKKHLDAKKEVDRSTTYTPSQAFDLLKKISYTEFSGSVEVHLNVIDKGLSGDVKLPHFQGKSKKIVTVTDEVIEELKAGQVNFDVLIASAADMPKLLPFAKLLGPKGLMPNPKNGTLVPDPQKAVADYGSSGTHYKTEKDAALIHLVIGKIDQPADELTANYKAVIKSVSPKNIKKAYLKTTMSPAVRVIV